MTNQIGMWKSEAIRPSTFIRHLVFDIRHFSPMGFLSFTAWQFALAGAICAAGPVIIHLLNRRRFKVVQWAAMDFLREAMQRNRRIMQIRDIILLVLRTAAVLLFGLALGQPFFATREEQFNDRQPLHAVDRKSVV